MQNQKIRVIGGKLKGRQIEFTKNSTLRPTGDRIRETLFNWLQFDLNNKNVLDLFAGSGVLGIECLSRGAGHVTFIDYHKNTVQQIQSTVDDLEIGEKSKVLQFECINWLQHNDISDYSLIFVDPPFSFRLHLQLLDELLLKINKDACVYLEYPIRDNILQKIKEDEWEIVKQKKMSQVGILLIRKTTNNRLMS